AVPLYVPLWNFMMSLITHRFHNTSMSKQQYRSEMGIIADILGVTMDGGTQGVIFVRIHYILTTMVRAPVVAACFLLLTLSSFVQYAIGSPKVLDFTIYADGTTHVFYQTDVDPQSPDFVMNAYGGSIENLVVQDENGTLLSSKVDTSAVTVATLGASTIKADYDTPDLISKNGKTWTFHVNSPVDYSILLPKNTV